MRGEQDDSHRVTVLVDRRGRMRFVEIAPRAVRVGPYPEPPPDQVESALIWTREEIDECWAEAREMAAWLQSLDDESADGAV